MEILFLVRPFFILSGGHTTDLKIFHRGESELERERGNLSLKTLARAQTKRKIKRGYV